MSRRKLSSAQQKALAEYRQLPGWPKRPTLALAERQARGTFAPLQMKYEAVLAESRRANGGGNA